MAERARTLTRAERTRRQSLHLMVLFLLGGEGLFTVVALILWLMGSGILSEVLASGVLTVLGGVVFLLNRRGQYRAAGVLLVGLLMLAPLYFVLVEGPRNVGLLLMVGAVVYGDFLLGRRSGLVVAGSEAVLYAAAGLVYEQGWIQGVAYEAPLFGDVATLVLVSFALAFSVGVFTREMRQALQGARQQEQALHAAEMETDRLLAQVRAREEGQRQLLEQVQELDCPIIPLGQGVIAVPIIGIVDSRRAGNIAGDLLRGVEKHRARFAVIDVTGVPVGAGAFGMMLLQMAQGVQLLGAEPILTGISPAVAETLVDTGLDFSLVTFKATLQEGLDYALKQQRGEKANGVARA